VTHGLRWITASLHFRLCPLWQVFQFRRRPGLLPRTLRQSPLSPFPQVAPIRILRPSSIQRWIYMTVTPDSIQCPTSPCSSFSLFSWEEGFSLTSGHFSLCRSPQLWLRARRFPPNPISTSSVGKYIPDPEADDLHFPCRSAVRSFLRRLLFFPSLFFHGIDADARPSPVRLSIYASRASLPLCLLDSCPPNVSVLFVLF